MRKTLQIAAAMAALTAAGAATAQDRWDWRPGEYRLIGAGARALYPELRNTPRGRAFVMRNFDVNRDGRVQRHEAVAANRAFAAIAGSRRERFDWERGDRVAVFEDRAGGWDRGAMRGYGLRQTQRGAMLNLSADVLFATDSAALRPAAIDKLRPLAAYLRANPGVRVAIDGHTDARGSDAHNLSLSERRAESVRDALIEMGADRARFAVAGHGEGAPTASNATAAGQRLNRRVEVTLLGRRTTEFEG